MSFRIYSKIKSIFLVFALGFLSVSCAQKEKFDTAVGYLYAPQLDVDVVVEDVMATKASTDSPDVSANAPEVSTIRFVVKDKDGSVVYDADGLWTEALVLPVGKYTITATYGDNIFDAPYFTASVEGIIEALDEEMPEIQMELGNSMVMVNIADALAQHFQGTASVKVSNKESAIENIELGKWYYVPSGEDLTITLAGTNAAGTPTTLDHTLPAPQAKNAYRVECSTGGTTNLPQISLPDQQSGAWNTRLYITPATIEGGAISEENKAKLVYEVSASADFADAVTATNISGDYYYVGGLTNGSTYYVRARIGSAIVSYVHTVTIKENLDGAGVDLLHDNSTGILTGTNADLKFGLTGILQKLKTEGLLEVDATLTKGTTTYRTAFADGNMTASEGWPYIPQGTDYVLTIGHKLSSEDVLISSVISNVVNSPEPSFNVTLGKSYTSYDRYKGVNGFTANVDDANGVRNSEAIHDVSASWTISSDLMQNGNYTKSLVFYTDTDTERKRETPEQSSSSTFDITGLTTWKAYTLRAEVTFDGKTVKSNEKTHEITGLPYTAAPPSNSGNNPWTGNNKSNYTKVSFNSDYVEMSATSVAPYIISPNFNIPSDINVMVKSSVKVDGYKVGIWYNQNFIATIGGTEVFKQNSSSQTGKVFNPSGNGTFTNTNNTLKCASNRSTDGFNSYVYSISINYR